MKRLDKAAADIHAMVQKDPALPAEGAVRLFERLSPAFEDVDDSSGRLQSVIHGLFGEFVALIGTADVAARTRQAWLERLWDAMTADRIPWIEPLGNYWGTLRGGPELASAWADEFLPEPRGRRRDLRVEPRGNQKAVAGALRRQFLRRALSTH